jgi:hypothetical protein
MNFIQRKIHLQSNYCFKPPLPYSQKYVYYMYLTFNYVNWGKGEEGGG